MKAASAAALGAVVFLPRLVRLLHPQFFDEDTLVAAAGYLLSKGEAPYLDFVFPYLPTLEHLLGALLRLFGPSLLVPELLNQGAQAATALLLARIASRLGGPPAGLAAAALFSTSALVFRYHFYERETFAVLAATGAVALSLDGPPRGRRLVAVAACLAATLVVKFTALATVGAYAFWYGLSTRSWRRTLVLLALAGAPPFLLAVYYALAYGQPFFLQVFVFHFVKGWNKDFVQRLKAFVYYADAAFGLGAVGLLARLGRPFGPARRLLFAIGAFEAASLALGKSALWVHNFLPLLLPACVFGGEAAAEGIRAIRERARLTPRRALLSTAGILAVALPLADSLFPEARAAAFEPLGRLLGREGLGRGMLRTRFDDEPRGFPSAYGFGYRPRAEFERAAEEVRSACPPEKKIEALSPVLYLAADRAPVLRFQESYGVYRDLEEGARREGLVRAVRARAGRRFWGRIDATRSYQVERLAAAAAAGEVGAVVWGDDQVSAILEFLRLGDPSIRLRRVTRGPSRSAVFAVESGG